MMVIPAIDIKNGRCVRLLQGRMDQETVFSDDPAAMAKKWADWGAELIHVVDLDGAVEKKPQNLDALTRILASVDVPIQVGGGIRDDETVELLFQKGVRRVVLGTEAVRNPDWVWSLSRKHPGRIVVGIDARDGWAAVEGWRETTRIRAVDLARRFEGTDIASINFTDIRRDGMQTGPNLDETRKLAESTSIPVTASGGVSNLDDIRNVAALEPFGVTAVITGKALYTGALDLKAAIEIARAPQ